MSRDLAASVSTAAKEPTIYLADLVEFNFPGGALRVCTAARDVPWNGKLFAAAPALAGISDVVERADLKSNSLSFTFAGLHDDLLARALEADYHFAEVNGWLALFDDNWKLVGEPYQWLDKLLMSRVSITVEPNNAQITVDGESWERMGTRDAAMLASPEAQRLRYAGDSGMDRVADIPTEEVNWGGSFQRA